MESKPVEHILYLPYFQRFSAPSILFNFSLLEVVPRGRHTHSTEIIVYSSSCRSNLPFGDPRFVLFDFWPTCFTLGP